MKRTYEYLDKCNTNPLAKKDSAATDIRELLLSRTAADPEISVNKITKAIDDLIGLKYPLLNRILEAAAYYCKIGLLKIYFVNSMDVGSSQSYETHQAGYFNPNHGLIVIAGSLATIANTLIHELTHAVSYYLKGSNDFVRRHHNFCKNQFPGLLKKGMSATQVDSEQTELSDIDKDAQWFSELYKQRMQNCENNEFKAQSDLFKPGFVKIGHRRHRVAAQQQLRENFYGFFKPYNITEYADEFLPFFLGQFVTAAIDEQIEPFFELNNDSGEDKNRVYLLVLLDRMYSSLPSEVVDSFIKDDFRSALEEFLKPKWHSVTKLEDDVLFLCSVAEPQKIINSFTS